MSRTHLKGHCASCGLRQVLCLCETVNPIASRARLIIVMHWRETYTTTNTGRIATLALPNSEIRLRGLKDIPVPAEGLLSATGSSLLLYPSSDSVELTPELVAGLPGPIHLIVPDGTWKQASKVGYREPALAEAIHVRLPAGPPSRYRLRKAPNPKAVSTLEAIARAMEIVEGPELGPRIREELERILDLMVVRTLWSKGKLTLAETGTAIPEAAIQRAKPKGGSLPRSGS